MPKNRSRSRGSRGSRRSRGSRGSRRSNGSNNSRKIAEARRRTSRNPCQKGQILRKGYRRSSYSRTNKNGSTSVKETIVPPVCIRDVGRPGYGAKVIPPLTPHLLGRFGYSTKVAEKQRRRALNNAIKNYGQDEIYKHLRSLITLQRWNPNAHDIMLNDFNYLRQKYYSHRIGVYEPVGY